MNIIKGWGAIAKLLPLADSFLHKEFFTDNKCYMNSGWNAWRIKSWARCELSVVAGPGENTVAVEKGATRWARLTEIGGLLQKAGSVKENSNCCAVLFHQGSKLFWNFLPVPWSACFMVLPAKEGRGEMSCEDFVAFTHRTIWFLMVPDCIVVFIDSMKLRCLENILVSLGDPFLFG